MRMDDKPGSGGDVFVSFSSGDIAFAEVLIDLLNRSGISYYYYPHQNRNVVATDFRSDIVRALSRAKVVACIVSPISVDSRWVANELTFATEVGLAIVPLKIGSFDLPLEFKLMIGSALWREVDLLTDEAHVLERIKAEILKCHEKNRPVAPPPPPAPPPTIVPTGKPAGGIPPYPGPRSFDARMRHRFFGRDMETTEILTALNACRILVLYAPSGAGKSSLLAAGIIPELQRGVTQVFPKEDAAPLRINTSPPENPDMESHVNGFLFSLMAGIAQSVQVPASATLPLFLRSLDRPASARHRTIIIDQFEEIFFREYADRFQDRDEFIAALTSALADDATLRIVLSLRKEYLADVNDLLSAVGPAFPIQRYALKPVDAEGARRAITKPVEHYLRFEDGALDDLIGQLRRIKIRRQDGQLVYRESEFIEMAHLQIVCLRLWTSIAAGKVLVTSADIQRAAGAKEGIDALVVDALTTFYVEQVTAVAKHNPASKDSILFGCSKFVSAQGTRVMMRSKQGRTGRLLDKVAEDLADHYLLRRERRGLDTWYELSHDLFVEPVVSQVSRDIANFSFAIDLLERLLDKVLLERARSLDGYFVEQKDLLKECRPLVSQIELFCDEEELLLRAGIASDEADTRRWCLQMGKDFRERRDAVLREAVAADNPLVRCHAIHAVCDERITDLLPHAVAMATRDPEDAVRRTASLGLAHANDKALYEELARFLDHGEYRKSAIDTLAMIRNRAAISDEADRFPSFFSALPTPHKNAIRRRSAALRAREGLPLLITVFLLSAGLATLVATIWKFFPGLLGWGVSQHVPNGAIGMFQGAVAGVFWAGCICSGITVYYKVFGNIKKRSSAIRPLGALVFGGLSGLMASLIISIFIVGVFNADSLLKMGWLSPVSAQCPDHGALTAIPATSAPAPCIPGATAADGKTRSAIAYKIIESFLVTGFGWVNLITGTALGIGMALMSNAIRSTPQWDRFLRQETSKIESFPQLLKVMHRIALIARSRFWLLCLPVILAAIAAFYVPDTTSFASHPDSKANPQDLMLGLLGDCSTQVIGAYAGIVGMLLATIIVRHGVSIAKSGE